MKSFTKKDKYFFIFSMFHRCHFLKHESLNGINLTRIVKLLIRGIFEDYFAKKSISLKRNLSRCPSLKELNEAVSRAHSRRLLKLKTTTYSLE